jgi:hypothetical protein
MLVYIVYSVDNKMQMILYKGKVSELSSIAPPGEKESVCGCVCEIERESVCYAV